MGNPEFQFQPPEQKVRDKLTREEVVSRLERGENLENLDLSDLVLAGLNLEGISFRGSDIKGLCLHLRKDDPKSQGQEIRTNIKNADFTDTTMADYQGEVNFLRVFAEGAKFGYTENLIDRRKRHRKHHEESGEIPSAEDTGGLFSFNGMDGDFKNTTWANADFGGGSGYEALFAGADLSGAIMEGCDLSKLDLSQSKIEGITIIDPTSLAGLIINETQLEQLARAIKITDKKMQEKFVEKLNEKMSGSEKDLIEFLLSSSEEIIIVKKNK